MCIHVGECPQADMTYGRATICPLVSDNHNAYVGPLQGPFFQQSQDEHCNAMKEAGYGYSGSDSWRKRQR